MGADEPFLSSEHVEDAIDRLGSFAAQLTYEDLPTALRQRLSLMLIDLFGVVLAGMRTPELRALVEAWDAPPGEFTVMGTTVRTSAEEGAYLSAIAACALELDEGNKYASGHPAAHVVFAAMAATLQSTIEITGPQFLTAVAAGYEVAARFGRATHRNSAWHTHGHWGATGAATAAALISGCDASTVAAAIDASTGLMHVTPWATVLTGSFTRNLWLAGANQAGLRAARLARAGLVTNTGQAQYSLGEIVGSLDAAALIDGLGESWLATEGYLKRHASCSYTHAAVDIVQALFQAHPWKPDEVEHVEVRSHSLAGPLLGRHPKNRLAAMFSMPFVVSNAVVNGRVDPGTMEPGSSAFLAAEDFSSKVEVELSPALDAELPDRRCTEVTVHLSDGTSIGLGQPNPIGDAQHFPLAAADVRAKLLSLLDSSTVDELHDVVDTLLGSPSAGASLTRLSLVSARRAGA